MLTSYSLLPQAGHVKVRVNSQTTKLWSVTQPPRVFWLAGCWCNTEVVSLCCSYCISQPYCSCRKNPPEGNRFGSLTASPVVALRGRKNWSTHLSAWLLGMCIFLEVADMLLERGIGLTETLLPTDQSTGRHSPQDHHGQLYRRGNFRSLFGVPSSVPHWVTA